MRLTRCCALLCLPRYLRAALHPAGRAVQGRGRGTGEADRARGRGQETPGAVDRARRRPEGRLGRRASASRTARRRFPRRPRRSTASARCRSCSPTSPSCNWSRKGSSISTRRSRSTSRTSSPSTRRAQKPITLRMLMAHRSGLVRESPVGNYFDPTEPIARKDASRASTASNSSTRRASGRSTPTPASASSGCTLEKTQNEKFETYVQRRVLDPLGMKSSSFTADAGGEEEPRRRGDVDLPRPRVPGPDVRARHGAGRVHVLDRPRPREVPVVPLRGRQARRQAGSEARDARGDVPPAVREADGQARVRPRLRGRRAGRARSASATAVRSTASPPSSRHCRTRSSASSSSRSRDVVNAVDRPHRRRRAAADARGEGRQAAAEDRDGASRCRRTRSARSRAGTAMATSWLDLTESVGRLFMETDGGGSLVQVRKSGDGPDRRRHSELGHEDHPRRRHAHRSARRPT